MMSVIPLNKTKKFAVLFTLMPLLIICPLKSFALVFPETVLKIYQFPSNMIPRIDGNNEDWDMVPEDYIYRNDLLIMLPRGKDNTSVDYPPEINPEDLDIKVRVGWVKGLNRLYFLYEAYDNYWDFENISINDTFEISVDADLSGGNYIWDEPSRTAIKQGSHAQNFHIFTPAVNKAWGFVWNGPKWLMKLPYMNCAYSYDFKHGESGKIVVECWITPFDYASNEGPGFSTISQITENKIIGLSWFIADDDGDVGRHNASLSHDGRQNSNAWYLRPFKLMPLEEKYLEPFKAFYKFTEIDRENYIYAFKDLSRGKITSWKWDFGDGTTSTEQNPIHTYDGPAPDFRYGLGYIVTLYIEGTAGKSHYTTVFEVCPKRLKGGVYHLEKYEPN